MQPISESEEEEDNRDAEQPRLAPLPDRIGFIGAGQVSVGFVGLQQTVQCMDLLTLKLQSGKDIIP